jgi:hypothetical protein
VYENQDNKRATLNEIQASQDEISGIHGCMNKAIHEDRELRKQKWKSGMIMEWAFVPLPLETMLTFEKAWRRRKQEGR